MQTLRRLPGPATTPPPLWACPPWHIARANRTTIPARLVTGRLARRSLAAGVCIRACRRYAGWLAALSVEGHLVEELGVGEGLLLALIIAFPEDGNLKKHRHRFSPSPSRWHEKRPYAIGDASPRRFQQMASRSLLTYGISNPLSRTSYMAMIQEHVEQTAA